IALRQQIGVFPVANVSLMRITRILSSAVGWETESSTSSLTRSELTPSIPAALLDPVLWMTSSNSFQSVGIMRSAHTSEGMFFALRLYISFHQFGRDHPFLGGGSPERDGRRGGGSGLILSFLSGIGMESFVFSRTVPSR